MSLHPGRADGERDLLELLNARTDRRRFLRNGGMAAAVVALAGCGGDPLLPRAEGVTLDFSNDFGVLNYAYALEQLEAAFYTQVVASMFSGATQAEQRVLVDLRDHEIAHRELFAAALGANAIGDLTVDFDAVDFNSRQSVLTTARTFEDLGVGAFNGAGKYLSDPEFLTVAGKIVSVEARHASVIRTILGDDFAPDEFDQALEPADVLAAAGAFIENDITLRNT